MAYRHRGEIWLADLRPTRGREQTGRRPVLVLSVDFFNAGPADLIVVLPLTSTQRDIPLHVKVSKGDGGTKNDCVILCEAMRSVSKEGNYILDALRQGAKLCTWNGKTRTHSNGPPCLATNTLNCRVRSNSYSQSFGRSSEI